MIIMTERLYVTNRKALVFPVMCDAHLKIDPATDSAGQTTGLFAHDDSFTIQAIVTPYEINGLGWDYGATNNPAGVSGVVDSKKTMPRVQAYNTTEAHFQSYQYINSRLTHEMLLFYNENVSLSLVNNTLSHQNQPAEYKIKFQVNANGVTALTTSNVISASTLHSGTTQNLNSVASSNAEDVYHMNSDAVRFRLAFANVSSHTGGSNTITTSESTASNFFYVGQHLYSRTGQTFLDLGYITGIDGADLEMSQATSVGLSGSLYTDALKEAPYLLNAFHIAASYNKTTGVMQIFLNGDKVADTVHSTNMGFTFSNVTSYIGEVPSSSANSGALASTIGASPYYGTVTQFMGELHEFAITKGAQEGFPSTVTLIPDFRDILIYYRFEEANL